MSHSPFLDMLRYELYPQSRRHPWGRPGEISAAAAPRFLPRQTTPSPGGLADKGTKGKRARTVPLIVEIRPLIETRLRAIGGDPLARLFTGPRGGRITTAVLRDATHWDEVVIQIWSGRRDLNPRPLDPQARIWRLARSEGVGRRASHLQQRPG